MKSTSVHLLVHDAQSGPQDRWGIPLEETRRRKHSLWTGVVGADTGPAGSAAMDPGSPTASTVDLTGVSKVERVAATGSKLSGSTSPSSDVGALGL